MSVASVKYHYDGPGLWWAESPEYPEYAACGESLDEVRLLAHGGLRFMGATVIDDPFGPVSATTGSSAASTKGLTNV